jgi:hypothetical protein
MLGLCKIEHRAACALATQFKLTHYPNFALQLTEAASKRVLAGLLTDSTISQTWNYPPETR